MDETGLGDVSVMGFWNMIINLWARAAKTDQLNVLSPANVT
jgi:hypothetical protein